MSEPITASSIMAKEEAIANAVKEEMHKVGDWFLKYLEEGLVMKQELKNWDDVSKKMIDTVNKVRKNDGKPTHMTCKKGTFDQEFINACRENGIEVTEI